VGGDIREGKRTVPLWHAWTRADAAGKDALTAALGNADATDEQVARAIAVIEDSGALSAVEAEIETLADTADALIGRLEMEQSGRDSLAALLRTWGMRPA
jgi:geranylgeranyl diphosphate synthase type I